MSLPSLHQLGANLTELRLANGEVLLWFSYETPLAIAAPGVGLIVNADCVAVSRTSAKHLGQIGFGALAKERPRIPSDRFTSLVEFALALDFGSDNYTRSAETLVRVWEQGASRYVA